MRSNTCTTNCEIAFTNPSNLPTTPPPPPPPYPHYQLTTNN
jgi:hypothetical protein